MLVDLVTQILLTLVVAVVEPGVWVLLRLGLSVELVDLQ